jgi:nicotinamide mononucleotide transporter
LSTLEIFAAILGAISVWLTGKQNILCWPIGIVMVSIYAYIFYGTKLYSDMLLQVYFFVMQIVGWIAWTRKKTPDSATIKVSQLNSNQRIIWISIILILGLLLGKIMAMKTDATFPYFDAMLAVMSIVAQWLMTIKKIENWILWIVADLCYIFLYFYKQLYPTSILYFVFLGIAIIAFLEWRRSMQNTLS